MVNQSSSDSTDEKYTATFSLAPIPETIQCEIANKEDAVDVANTIRGKLINYYKREEKAGIQAGRSGGHGTFYKKAGSQLIRLANQLQSNHPMAKELKEALKNQGKRNIQKGNSINHPG